MKVKFTCALAMVAAFAMNLGVWAANATLSFDASGGSQTTSQFVLGSQSLTFDRTTIPSWITSLTLHQSIGGMINNNISLTPASGTWNNSGSSSTCTLDVTVAANTGAARSWTMNICNQSNGSVAWSLLVTQSAGGGGSQTTTYTVTFNPNGGSVSPTTRDVSSGSPVGSLPTPARSGYTFNGWWTAASGGMQISSSTAVSGNVAYYAHWTANAGAEVGVVLYVDATNGSDSNSGTSALSAKATIQAAVNAAVEGAVIYVAAGMYAPFYTDNKAIRIVGEGGAGVTFVDGGGDYSLANSVHLGYGSGGWDFGHATTNTVVEGLTMQNLCTVKGGTIRRCVIRNNDCGNVGGAPVNDSVLDNCLITGCRGMNGCASAESILRNCTVVGNSARDSKNVFIDTVAINCIAYGNEQGSYPLNSLWKYNNCDLVRDAEFWTKNVYTEDPLFVDAANGDYRLSEASPCIDAGDSDYFSDNTDLVGNARVVNGLVDIGCYEFIPATGICTVTYNANGGSVSPSSYLMARGSSVRNMPTPVRDGLVFVGWWTEAEGGERVTDSTIVTADVTFYAHWDTGFLVTFNANGGTVSETLRRVPQHGEVGTLPWPSRSGYAFDGWWTASTGGAVVSAKMVVDGDVTCYAHWEMSPYEWTYTGDASTGLTITGVSPQPSGFVVIPAALDGMPVVKLGGQLLTNNPPVGTTIVVPQGIAEIGARTFYALFYSNNNVKDLYLPPTFTKWTGYGAMALYRGSTMHWTIGEKPIESASDNFWGTIDYIALGSVPSGLGTWLFNQYVKPEAITYRCKRAYKDGWDAFFVNAGKTATFLGYIDDDYEYLDPILTISAGVLESVQLMGGRDVVIPDGVTEISANAFNGNTLLRSVTIPASVTTIATGAFSGCTGLECVSIPYSLDAVIANAFPNGFGGVEVVFTDDGMATGGDAGWGTDTATVHGGIVSRKSGAIGDNQASWIEMRTQNPGRLSFWWKASSESDGDLVFDYAYLSIDGVPQGTLLTANDEYELDGIAIGGKTGWQQVVLNVTGSGAHTIRWTYCKDEVDEGDTGEDCIWLDDVVFTPLVSATFNLGGGTGTTPVGFAESSGTVVTLPGQDGFSRTDYVFDGWSDGTTLYAAGAQYTMPSDNVTLTAQWTKKTFLTFALGGGTGTTPTTVKELRGTVVTLPGQGGFSRTDYVFDGWSDGSATYAAGTQYTMPPGDVTLTAQWIAKRFLTFTLDGGDGATPATIKDVPGTTITLPSADGIAKPKHTFVGWRDGTSTYDAGANYIVTESSVEFTAVWRRNELCLAISSDDVYDGGTISTQGATISMAAWPDPSGGTPAIHYTLDGSTPTTNSARYAAPFFADGLGEVTVKAIAVTDNYFDSEVATFTFTRLPYSPSECIGVSGVAVTTGGDAEWFRVTGDEAHDGIAALRSGAIGNSQSTYVEMTVRGSGNVSFWWKVSSQRKVRTNKHDYLSFTIDGIEISTLGGGAIDWTNETFVVEGDASIHTLRWTYIKDASTAGNEDCAWLDDVAWTPAETLAGFSDGERVGVGDAVTLTAAQATWLNGFSDYDTVRSAVAAMDAKSLEEAYLLNLDVTDGGRGYAFDVTGCDATGENVVVTVRLVRTGAVQVSGGGNAPINGVLRLYGSATPAESGFAPLATATVSDATFADGGTATLTLGKGESVRFFKACIVSP